jgi:hypothetical protein
MTANELADYLDNNVEAMLMSEQPYLDQAATMLRQQQAEIEALKKALEPWVMYVDEFAQVPLETWEKLADCAKMTSEWKKK